MRLIKEAARQLQQAAHSKIPCTPIRELIGETDQELAYEVQNYLTQERLNLGAKIIGKKIGLTSEKVQQQLGVNQPDYGILFDDMQIPNGGSISVKQLMQPKAEAEIAFVLKKKINSTHPSVKELVEAIDYIVGAIEIVGSRISNWDIKITDTIADNASASHFVLGDVKKQLNDIDIIGCEMQLFKNNHLVSEGCGSACLGSPLVALQWLAKKMSSLGSPLNAGDIILSGALGPMVEIMEEDNFKATIEGLGDINISFTK